MSLGSGFGIHIFPSVSAEAKEIVIYSLSFQKSDIQWKREIN